MSGVTVQEFIARHRAESAQALAIAWSMDIHDAETFDIAALRAGRNNGPALLFDAFYSGMIGVEHLPAIVADVWASAEFPQRVLGIAEWVRFFRLAAYPAPPAPLTLYRGATRGRGRGMAWTTDLDRARWFAARPFGNGGATVWTVEAHPASVLADIGQLLVEGRGESEIVVDPRTLPPVSQVRP